MGRFWINSNPNLPYDLNVFNNNMMEKIKRVRNHPSIAVWCGDNESNPQPPLEGWMAEISGLLMEVIVISSKLSCSGLDR